MATQLTEAIDLICERVDRESNVIRGAKLVGLKSKNGRRYSERALIEAIGLYEGASVFVNHPRDNPRAPRDYQERIAGISGVHFKTGEGLFGNLSVNPKAPSAEAFLWDAEQNTKGVGLSHNVMCESRRDGGETVIESIAKVNSVDLVVGPATTSGIYEQQRDAAFADVYGNADDEPANWRPSTVEQFQRIASGRRSGRQHQHSENEEMSANKFEQIASGPRYGHSTVTEAETMSLGNDQTSTKATADARDALREKLKTIQGLDDAEREKLMRLLDTDIATAEQYITEAIDNQGWQPTSTDKFRQMCRR